jgi:hypothetical protein
MDSAKKITVNPSMGKRAPLWGIFHVSLVISWGSIICFVGGLFFALNSIEVEFPLSLPLSIIGALCAAEWILVGDRPWLFWGKFLKGKRRIKSWLRFNPSKNRLKPRPSPVKIEEKSSASKKGSSTSSAIENQSDLGRRVGAYLLQKDDEFRVTFAFQCEGFGTSISDEEGLEIARAVQEGLKSLVTTEAVTFEASTRSDCSDRLSQLQKKINSNISAEIKYLLRWDQERAKGLTRLHRHNPKRFTIYYTYTVGAGSIRADDIIESSLYYLQAKYKSIFIKPHARAFRNQIEALLLSAFNRGFGNAEDYLSEILGLPVTPLRAQDIWAIDWAKFNDSFVPLLPHMLLITKDGMKVKGLGSPHVASKLHPAAPIEHKDHVFLPGRKKYVGFVVADQRPNQEWSAEDPSDRLRQIFFGSSALNNPKVYDTTITVQFTGQNQTYALKNAEGLAKAGNRDLKTAEDRRRIDQGAQHKLQKALGAGWILREGGVSVRCAVVVQIERDTLEDLDVAIQSFCNLPEYRGQVMAREYEYAHLLFHQVQPYSWKKLLKSPFDRRLEDTTHFMMCFLPLLFDQMPDTDGVEFVSQTGFTPVYLNPFGRDPHNHCVTVAKTGKGKSVGIVGSIISALAENGNVIIVDAGRADGSGSFDPITKFVNGSYYNTLTDSYNLFEGADFRKMSNFTNKGKEESAQNIAKKTFKKFLCNALRDLVLGDNPDKNKAFQYNKILAILVDSFLAGPEIQALYNAAYDDGLGSESWQKMPTLRHFAAYLKVENLPEGLRTPDVAQAVKEMSLSIESILARPIGEAIGRPSTFRSNSKLTVVAMGGLSDNAEAMPLALCAAAFVLSSSLSADRTLFIGDESSYLANFDAYMQIVASFFSGGRKMGVWGHLLLQSLENLSRSPHCADILDNTTTYFIGVVASSVLEFLKTRNVPKHLLKVSPKKGGVRYEDALTSWIFTQPEEGNHCKVYFAPNFGHLALAVNGKEDIAKREEFEALHPDDKYKANSEFAKWLRDNTSESLAELHLVGD